MYTSYSIFARTQIETRLDAHLHVSGLPEKFALLVDAHLVVEEERLPVHTTVLAMASPIFSDLFISFANSKESHRHETPLSGHTVQEVCAVLEYLYQRHANTSLQTPSRSLWESPAAARSIIKFAHKYDMFVIVLECDAFLCQRAEENPSSIFQNIETTVAWAALAEECNMKTFLSHAEFHMVSSKDRNLWQHPAFAKHGLSSASLLRMLRAAQMNLEQKLFKPSSVLISAHVSSTILLSWQQR